MLKFKTPALKALQRKAVVEPLAELQKVFTESDVEIDQEDIMSLLFTLGPDGISTMIRSMLISVSSVDDVAVVAQYIQLRHSILHSLAVHGA